MKNVFRSLPFRHKITLFCITIVVTALFIFHLYSNTLFSNAFLESTKEHTSNQLNLVNQNINLMVERTETYIRLLSIDTEFQSILNQYLDTTTSSEQSDILFRFPNTVTNLTSGIFSPSADMAGIVLSMNGNVIYPVLDLSLIDIQSGLSEEHMNAVNNHSAPLWQSTLFKVRLVPNVGTTNNWNYINYIEEQNVVALSKKILDRTSGRNLGILSLLLNETAFSSVFENKEGNYYLVDQNATIVSCSDKELLYKSAYDVFNIEKEQFQLLKNDSSIHVSDKTNNYMLTLAHNESLNWDLILFTDLEAFSQEQSRVNTLMITVLIITIIIMSLTIYICASAITRPIAALLDITQKYDETHTYVRAPEEISGEIGALAKGFNQLLDKVEENIQHIELVQSQKHQYELQLLQEQIRPHFLYNALQTATSLIQLQHYEESIDSLYALSDFYKYCFSSGKDIITLAEEIKIIENYLKIQHLRYIDYFDFSIEVENGLQSLLLPKLTLQPLVENSIYHGLKPKNKKGILIIKASNVRNGILLEIRDTGVGMTPIQIESLLSNVSSGTTNASSGFRNVIERLRLLYGQYFSFNIDSMINEYTNISIQITNTSQKGENPNV